MGRASSLFWKSVLLSRINASAPFFASQFMIQFARPPILRSFCTDGSHKRSGQRSFRQCCKSNFAASDQVATSKKASQRKRKHDRSESVVKLKQQFTEEVTTDAEHRGPDDATTGIGNQKSAPGHAVQSSKN